LIDKLSASGPEGRKQIERIFMKTEHALLPEDGFSVKQAEANDEAKLAYIEKGEGEPVVFIHGAVSDFRTWIEQIEFFSAMNYRAVSYSRRFHRPNAEFKPGAANYSRSLHTSDLVGFLRALDAGKAHLVGHSYGASIALMTALDHPELVGSLVLGEPSPFPTLLDKETERRLLLEQKAGFDKARRLMRNGQKEEAVRHFLHVVVGVDVFPLLPEERRAVVLENADTLEPMLETYYESPSLNAERLKSVVGVPTLLVTGELSPRLARLSNEAINRLLPDSRISVLRRASHGLQMENPEGFNRMVGNFLAARRLSRRQSENRDYSAI
jgi:pimeloyl-ACP methyl ester carboxylesterase